MCDRRPFRRNGRRASSTCLNGSWGSSSPGTRGEFSLAISIEWKVDGPLSITLVSVESSNVPLVIATGAAAVALVGLVWQLTLYRLSGARLEVRLTPGVVVPRFGSITSAIDSGWREVGPPTAFAHVDDTLWADLAVIRVTNVGRVATSVSGVGLDFGTVKRWRRFARITVTAQSLTLGPDCLESEVIRLEPGEWRTAYIPVWGYITWRRSESKGHVVVRATASLAGRRSKRSSRRRRWKIRSSAEAIYPHASVTAESRVFAVLLANLESDSAEEGYEAWLSCWPVLSSGADRSALSEVLEPHVPSILKRERMVGRLRSAYEHS